jgi:peroxiredoxin Q/BCP
MIDLPKATKGRRMSKKTRKKIPQTPARKAAKSKAKKTPAGRGRVATKSSPQKPAARAKPASHAAASKALKASAPPKTNASTSESKPASRAAKSQPGAAAGALLGQGAKAPAFQLPRDGGSNVSLADYAGQKLVIFFYPRADTPGCTKEAIEFTRLSAAFADADTAVLGVSADDPKAQEAFRDKHQLSVPLLSDEPREMLQAYGVWGEKTMYGKTFLGIIRTTVLVGADGRILKIWRNVKVDGHAEEVLAAAQAA